MLRLERRWTMRNDTLIMDVRVAHGDPLHQAIRSTSRGRRVSVVGCYLLPMRPTPIIIGRRTCLYSWSGSPQRNQPVLGVSTAGIAGWRTAISLGRAVGPMKRLIHERLDWQSIGPQTRAANIGDWMTARLRRCLAVVSRLCSGNDIDSEIFGNKTNEHTSYILLLFGTRCFFARALIRWGLNRGPPRAWRIRRVSPLQLLKPPGDRFHGFTRCPRILRSQAGSGDVGNSAVTVTLFVPSGET
jgi:hypothetical protein